MISSPIKTYCECRLCGSQNINTVFKLAPTPPEDKFVREGQLNQPQECYPLNLALCEQCGYLHLQEILDPKVSYSEYTYKTNVTLGLSQHYIEYAEDVMSVYGDDQASFVIDLGSNDGTMLSAFKLHGLNVLGVEPAKQIAQSANANGILTINDFFTDQVRASIVEKFGKATIITANYMFANIENLLEFVCNVDKMLDENGIFVVLTGYHPEQMRINMFDYIYHEHFSYFSVTVLGTLFERFGLELIDAKKVPAKGGSIRVIAQKRGAKRAMSDELVTILAEEQENRVHDPSTYYAFAKTIDGLKYQFLELCRQYQNKGHRLVGYGASHSTTTLVYHYDLAEILEYQVDDNPIKHGMFSPGHHLPVHSSEMLYDDKPDVVVILAWNYATPIIKKHSGFVKQGGIFLVPLPAINVIEE